MLSAEDYLIWTRKWHQVSRRPDLGLLKRWSHGDAKKTHASGALVLLVQAIVFLSLAGLASAGLILLKRPRTSLREPLV